MIFKSSYLDYDETVKIMLLGTQYAKVIFKCFHIIHQYVTRNQSIKFVLHQDNFNVKNLMFEKYYETGRLQMPKPMVE